MATSILAKMAVQIVANNAQFAAAMKQSEIQMRGFQKTAQSLNTTLRGFGAGLGLMELARGIQFAVGTIADFEKGMSEVRAITNASDKEFKSLRESALELGRSTKFTAQQVAELQVAYGRLGFSTQEILNSTEATLQLATATGEDLAKSADIAGSTLRAFNLDATEMQRVVDVMAASFNKSALGLDNFGEAIKYVAPVAAAANISLEETTAMLGVLADAGIRGSMAGTSLRKIISDVKNESGTLAERLQKLADKGLTGAEAMDEVGRTAYASLLILTKHVDKVKEGAEAYKNVTGEAQKMADLMSDNLTGDVTKLTSALDGLILKFSDGAGALRDLVQGFTKFITLLSDDGVIKTIKAWFSVVSFIPRQALNAINSILDALVQEEDAFKKMQEARRKAWEATLTKQEDEVIKKTNEAREAIVKYTAAYQRLVATVGFVKPTKDTASANFTKDDFRAGKFSQDELINSWGVNMDDPVDGIVKEIEYNDELAKSLEGLNELRQQQIDKMMATAQMAETMGAAIGGAFEQMISGEQNFAQALASVTEQIITMYLQQSIAAMIASAIKDPSTPFPFAKVAIAAAGIGAVKALFNQIGGSNAGGGGGSGAPGRTPSQVGVRIDGRIRGNDLAIVNSKTVKRKGRLG